MILYVQENLISSLFVLKPLTVSVVIKDHKHRKCMSLTSLRITTARASQFWFGFCCFFFSFPEKSLVLLLAGMCLSNAGFICISCGDIEDAWDAWGRHSEAAAPWDSSRALSWFGCTYLAVAHYGDITSLALAAAVTLKCIRCYQRKYLAKLFFFSFPWQTTNSLNNGWFWLWVTNVFGRMCSPCTGQTTTSWMKPRQGNLCGWGAPWGIPRWFPEIWLLYTTAGLQELPESGQDRFSSASSFCGSLVSVQIIWFMPAESYSLEVGPGFKC